MVPRAQVNPDYFYEGEYIPLDKLKQQTQNGSGWDQDSKKRSEDVIKIKCEQEDISNTDYNFFDENHRLNLKVLLTLLSGAWVLTSGVYLTVSYLRLTDKLYHLSDAGPTIVALVSLLLVMSVQCVPKLKQSSPLNAVVLSSLILINGFLLSLITDHNLLLGSFIHQGILFTCITLMIFVLFPEWAPIDLSNTHKLFLSICIILHINILTAMYLCSASPFWLYHMGTMCSFTILLYFSLIDNNLYVESAKMATHGKLTSCTIDRFVTASSFYLVVPMRSFMRR